VTSRDWEANTYLHLVHHGSYNDDTSIGVFQGMFPPRNGNTVLSGIHVAIDDVVLAADQNARWSIEPVRRSKLATGNLYEQIGPSVGRLTPLAHDVVKPQIEFVVRQHLTKE
jgi:hypothetical protein